MLAAADSGEAEHMRRTILAVVAVMTLAGCGSAAAAPVPYSVPSRVGSEQSAGSAASEGPPIVVTLGDSVPAGTACDCDPFPELYVRDLRPPGVSVNDSKPGFTSADVRSQLGDRTVRSALDGASVVLIMIGANDVAAAFDHDNTDTAGFQAAADTVEQNVDDIVTTIRGDRTPAPVVLVLGYWNVVKDGAVGLAQYGATGERSAVQATRITNAALRKAAAGSGARYVTTTPVFKGKNRNQDPTALLAADGDHPDAAGHQAIAQAVVAAQPTP
jgi:acyl-CoA thioesterase I